MAINAVDRAISSLHRIIIGLAYTKKIAPSLPLFEQDYSGSVETVVNRYVEYASRIGERITPCAAPKEDNKPDAKFEEPKNMDAMKQFLEMELDVIRGVGFREAELVAVARKLVEIELAILRAAQKLTAQ
jgi:hypothetical protein